MNEGFWQFSYLAAAILIIFSIKWLNTPVTARRGVLAGEVGMLLAVVGTLLRQEVLTYEWVLGGFALGAAIGAPLAYLMPMTSVPQLTALSHAFGAFAAALVGTAEYYRHAPDGFTMAALVIETLLGFLTFTASIMAFAKLQELVPTRPLTYPGQNFVNLGLLAFAAVLGVWLVAAPAPGWVFPAFMALSLLFGVLLIVPIGGGDMPTVIALLNSYAGMACAAMGFALNNKLLIIAGALNAASGFILSVIMCKAMNRSFISVIAGGFGAVADSGGGAKVDRPWKRGSAEDAAFLMKQADSVIIVPGYGMAVAQAQHALREMGDLLKKEGVSVKYAIHPVAGRMPGHMNVLLAEANVPYDEVFELEDINGEFAQADVAFVIGANDVVNPAAKTDKTSPIYGMPVLDVDKAKTVLFIKRSMGGVGYAGVDNDVFYMDQTMMLLADAKKMVDDIVKALAH